MPVALPRCAMSRIAAAALTAILVAAGAAATAQLPTLLIVSRLDDKRGKDGFVDLTPHLEPALRDTGRYDVVAYRKDLPAIKTALEMHAIDTSDLAEPLTAPAVHKIAAGIGARFVVTVTAYAEKTGVIADSITEMRLGGGTWSTLSADHMTPGAPGGKRLSLLESVHALVGGIAEKVTLATSRAAADSVGSPQPTNSGAPPRPSPSAATPPPAARSDSSVAVARSPARASGPSTYDLLIDRARRNGDVANLILALRRAITENPRDVRLRRDLIRAYTDRGWPEVARDEASRAVSLAPNDPALHRLMGDAYLQSGASDSAVQEYREALRLGPKDPLNHLALGDAYSAAGQPDAALQEYRAAIAADSGNGAAHRKLAVLYAGQGQYAESDSELRAAKGGGITDDAAAADLDALFAVVEAQLTDSLKRTLMARNAFRSGTKNREESFKEVTASRKRADELSTFLSGLPNLGLDRVQALYSQAASMVVQHADKLQDYLESESTTTDEEARLLHIEANKQIGDAGKALKAAIAARKR